MGVGRGRERERDRIFSIPVGTSREPETLAVRRKK